MRQGCGRAVALLVRVTPRLLVCAVQPRAPQTADDDEATDKQRKGRSCGASDHGSKGHSCGEGYHQHTPCDHDHSAVRCGVSAPRHRAVGRDAGARALRCCRRGEYTRWPLQTKSGLAGSSRSTATRTSGRGSFTALPTSTRWCVPAVSAGGPPQSSRSLLRGAVCATALQCLIYYEYCFPSNDDEQREMDTLRLECLLNSASCRLRTKQYSEVVDLCTQVCDAAHASLHCQCDDTCRCSTVPRLLCCRHWRMMLAALRRSSDGPRRIGLQMTLRLLPRMLPRH
jgi:hypothetical protein